MTVKQAIEARRSIRKYLPDQVPADDLRLILEAARLAPSGCNAQPWRFVVVSASETREAIASEAMTLIGNEIMCREAPAVIVCLAVVDAHCEIPDRINQLSEVDPNFATPTVAKRTGRLLKSRFDKMPPEQRAAYMALNTAIALTHMTLQATELGYGTCWIKAFDDEAARRILNLPDGIEIVAFTPLGRPAEEPKPRPRLSLEDIAFSERYGEALEF